MNGAAPLTGRVVRLGDDVNTDVVLAGEYLNLTDPEEFAAHLLERFEPAVADRIGPGTILLAGRGNVTLKPGRHVLLPRETPLTNLHLSMLDRMGVSGVERHGDSTGRLSVLS